MSDKNTAGGMNFLGWLTLLFITLKLTHNVDWSWWWVLSPIWISFSIVGIIILVILIVALAAKLCG